LVYNLATLATSKPESFESDTFFHTLVAYINSFIAVFFYWSRFTLLLDHIRYLDDLIIIIALVFLILVTLIPVSYIELLQLRSQTVLIFSYIIQILTGSFLILLWRILVKDEILGIKARYFILQISVITVIYVVALFVSFLNLTLAFVIPVTILPLFLLIRHRYQEFI